MVGSVIKIHSNFYYVKYDRQILECKIREKLKKERIEILVGDQVQLDEINPESNQAVITSVLERKNYIPRPAIANIDQIIIISALNHPKFDFNQMDRYLTQAKIYDIPAVICINKSDLDDSDNIRDKIIDIYEPLGYKILFTSAKTGIGIEEFKEILNSKRTVLSGTSGVGKSSLLNRIHEGLKLKTKQVSQKTLRGTHATRHVELLEIQLNGDKLAEVGDTPGFSYLKFDNVLPDSLDNYFDEISEFAKDCYYSDCLHLQEDGCNILVNLNKIALTRYESYKAFVNEALEYKKKLSTTGHKIEEKAKTLDTEGKEKVKIVKLGTQSREKSRKNQKQKLNFISSLEDAYYNNEE